MCRVRSKQEMTGRDQYAQCYTCMGGCGLLEASRSGALAQEWTDENTIPRMSRRLQ